ncbi:MAG: GNAT family N-acetyltransferase [Pseudomonadales bacterium]
MKTAIHVWHLEIADPVLIPPETVDRPYQLDHLEALMPELARFLYSTVGAPWTWYMRLPWTYRQWQSRIDDPNVQFWMATIKGHPAGYFELEKACSGDVEICFFGLLPAYIGKGLGKSLLQDAIRAARQLGGKRIWLHTCTLDHPRALSNYQARGFRVFREEDLTSDIPDAPIEPWPNANAGDSS